MDALFLAASILFQRPYTEPGAACPEGLRPVDSAVSCELGRIRRRWEVERKDEWQDHD